MLAAYDHFIMLEFFPVMDSLSRRPVNPTVGFVSLQYPADPSDAQSCISSTQFLLAK
jgi:hypothetical protein